jgi:anaerobic magnesium-protoporphyrin IX monomethyl ester cyclase
MADVLLTHSYHLPYDHKQLRKMQPYRPLGTLYAAAALRAAGFSVVLFDTMLSDPEKEFADFLTDHNPRIVVIYEDDFNFLTKMCLTRMREVAWHITEIAKRKDIPVVVHGSDATDHPELFLSHDVDYVLRGEAEQTLVSLCSGVLNQTSFGEIEGLVHCGNNGEAAYSRQPLSKNPDWIALPQPPQDLTGFAPYRKAWKEAHGYFSVNMVSSRGCPYHCNWCAKPISGNKFHLRSASAVAEEMRQLKVYAQAEHIWFSDDVFALNRHWVQEFAVEVNRRDAALPFKIQSRADLMTDQTVAALQAAGCCEVWMGVESGSQKILDAMDKGLRLAEIRTARERLQDAGIRACYFLQFGYPGEQWQDLQETIAFVRSTRPDDIGISFSYPLPGTVFYERVQAQLGAKRNWADSDDLCIMFQAEYTSEFYRAVRNALHAEVDTWTCSGEDAEKAVASVAPLWDEIFILEPTSRNPNALVLSGAPTGTTTRPTDLIPVHQLTGITGV